MEEYFLEKVEGLREKSENVINEIIELIDENSFGSNDDEIDELENKLELIQKKIKQAESKIQNNNKNQYFLETIEYLKEKEENTKNLIQEYFEENSFGSNDNILDFLKHLLKENRKDQKQIENKISNFINSNSNNNSNKQDIKIDISPTFHQSQTQNTNLEIHNLMKEVENEIKNGKKPAKSSIRQLLESGIKLAKPIIEFLLKF